MGAVARCVHMALLKAGAFRPPTGAFRSMVEELTPCMVELRAFRKTSLRATPTNLTNLWPVEPVEGIREACRLDAARSCPGMVGAELTACLRQKRFSVGKKTEKLSAACAQKVFELQQQLSQDVLLSPELSNACLEDLKRIAVCKPLPGSIMRASCFKEHKKDLGEKCRAKLFKFEVQSAEDVRLNADVYENCADEIKESCGDKEFGEARILQCLWETSRVRSATKRFSSLCKEKVLSLTTERMQDYRLDFGTRSKCAKDVDALCAAEKALVDNLTMTELFGAEEGDPDAKSGQVLRCLKMKFDDITSSQCIEEIQRVIRVQAVDAKADAILSRECRDDIGLYCKGVAPDAVHGCLRRKMNVLSPGCLKAEALQGTLEASNIYMKPKMATLCKTALVTFCRDVQPGHAEAIRCLQDHMSDAGFPASCKEEVYEDLLASNHDWRLKYGISHMCKEDAATLCQDVLEDGAGQVLACLKNAYAEENIEDKGCKDEMLRFVSQGISDIRLAPNTYKDSAREVSSSSLPCAGMTAPTSSTSGLPVPRALWRRWEQTRCL
ncbi:unnamed protein product [Prorocentrum cordatum]|uniref:Golgi apparatus protein 1 n=1 Tax=Prorocentrum cordatum TaxID=2364126 RepID=A0ABN9VGL6_9DINO|nr:unnamed protein product [Polarella glacialis]